ncbi:MAG: SCP2 sterol-binding domain-containing protein [Xanthomonadales bacterium]|nr:SCP2 sterol-binding domain-containing protein [Xanthomonadales bacterium]
MTNTATNALIPPPLRRLFGATLERALNRALALDPEAANGLARLDGQRVGLKLLNPPIALSIRIEGERLRVGPPTDDESDLDISASLGAVVSRLLPDGDRRSPSGKLRVNGDAELAQRLQKLAQGFDPDWQQPFVDVFGEVIGVQVAKGLRDALRWGQRQGGHFTRDVVDYLTEESRDLAHRIEIEDFNDAVDKLRGDSDRLEARIKRLTARLPGKAATESDA